VSILERLSELRLLTEIHPNLVWDDVSRQNLEMLDFANIKPLHGIKLELDKANNLRKLAYTLWFLHQPVEKAQAILRKLRYPSTQVKDVLAACRLWKDLPWVANAKLSMIANRLEDVPPIAIYASFLAARDDNICNNFQAYLNRRNTITPKVTGEDLRQRGLPPGPTYKRILGAIRDAWLDGKIENNDQEQAYLDELIKNEPGLHPSS
jgi:tRNA nucleotidyltransferase (CCA-adding enzyme)